MPDRIEISRSSLSSPPEQVIDLSPVEGEPTAAHERQEGEHEEQGRHHLHVGREVPRPNGLVVVIHGRHALVRARLIRRMMIAMVMLVLEHPTRTFQVLMPRTPAPGQGKRKRKDDAAGKHR
jgi:hypothetical protein